jgi:L,D-peptidoglycan transpeptidase YkuD (ErfK/YbiS/YcfS/YnhG family)
MKLLTLFILFIFCNQFSAISPGKTAISIARKAFIEKSVNQMIVVYNLEPTDNLALLFALERKNEKDAWKVHYGPIHAGIGMKGFAFPGEKREGDKKTPTGLFALGKLFCYNRDPKTRMPWQQSTADDKWIDDPDSPDYNLHVQGVTSAKSFENLKIRTNDYKYCMVIEYNTRPVVKGLGSAIFLHLPEGENINPSAGCLVVPEKDLEWLLRWMEPEKNPTILMGNKHTLLKKNRLY